MFFISLRLLNRQSVDPLKLKFKPCRVNISTASLSAEMVQEMSGAPAELIWIQSAFLHTL